MSNRLLLISIFILMTVFSADFVFPDNSLSDIKNMSPSVQQQIRTLSQEKASRSLAQRKMDSQLIYALKRRQRDPMIENVPQLRESVDVSPAGTVLVDISATVTSDLLAEIKERGGDVINSFETYHAIRARLPLASIESLANNSNIRFIRPAIKPIFHKVNTSEGDVAHSASIARSTYSVDGTGIKVGVLSDSVDYLATVQKTGDLPAVTVLEDLPGESGEGTAMLEIIYDLAPGAELYFATAGTGMAGFATNINRLADAGCDIIVDDVLYPPESPFQDDSISQAVGDVISDGVVYFSSAGNSGNFNDGTSGVWEGDYNAIPDDTGLLGLWSSIHDFSAGDTLNEITQQGMDPFYYTLFWADPLGASGNDYDFFVVSSDGTDLIFGATNFQDGDDDPYEYVSEPGDQTNRNILIAKYTGDDVFIHFSTNEGQLEYSTTGQIRGHAAVPDAFAVAAVSAAGKTGPFTGSESVEDFSSDGPRRVFFNSDGTPITPGNFSSTGGYLRQKPDIAAADGVMCATPGFNPFYGTSAAAPHAAAIAALMLDAVPALSTAHIRDAFNTSAFDIEASGWDRDSGYGLIMADEAVRHALTLNPAAGPAINLLLLGE